MRTARLWWFVGALGLLRLASLAWYPLTDPTEARYGNIARIMLEGGNWLVPHIDGGLPFWGKPPLAFWLSAASAGGLGDSEIFLRLPHFLAGAAVLLLLWHWVRGAAGRDRAAVAVTVVAATFGFLLVIGTLMTDMLLCLAMTMAMTGFWRGWHGEGRGLAWMYAGLGVGLLAKGPVILVLAAIALLPWMLGATGWRALPGEILRRLHPLPGVALVGAIALPWYLAAEWRTPGFLEYFLLGEHVLRFVDAGWTGDLYGSAHAHPRGTIWLYWVLFALPWSGLLIVRVLREPGAAWQSLREDRLLRFGPFWAVSPMLLFTLAGNILPAYIAPGLPALGLLVARSPDPSSPRLRWPLYLAGPVLAGVVIAHLALAGAGDYSDKALVAAASNNDLPLYYLDRRPDSASFYSGGRARVIEKLPADDRYYLVADNRRDLAADAADCRVRAVNTRRTLYRCGPPDAS